MTMMQSCPCCGAEAGDLRSELRDLIPRDAGIYPPGAGLHDDKIYFVPGGEFHRMDQNGNKDNGLWQIEVEDAICLERRKRNCWQLKSRSDGGYDVHGKRSGQLKKTWRVVKGNPYNL